MRLYLISATGRRPLHGGIFAFGHIRQLYTRSTATFDFASGRPYRRIFWFLDRVCYTYIQTCLFAVAVWNCVSYTYIVRLEAGKEETNDRGDGQRVLFPGSLSAFATDILLDSHQHDTIGIQRGK